MGRVTGRGKTTCEACPQIDISRWHRSGRFRPGASFTTTWSRPVAGSLFLTVQVQPSVLKLTHTWCSDDHSPEPVEQTVSLDAAPCRFGGYRTWFRCPACHHRAAILYFAGCPGLFACRRCHDLTYAAQTDGPQFRGLRRANRLRVRLGGQPGMDFPIPDKPSHMHRATYATMVEMIQRLEAAVERRNHLTGLGS